MLGLWEVRQGLCVVRNPKQGQRQLQETPTTASQRGDPAGTQTPPTSSPSVGSSQSLLSPHLTHVFQTLLDEIPKKGEGLKGLFS